MARVLTGEQEQEERARDNRFKSVAHIAQANESSAETTDRWKGAEPPIAFEMKTGRVSRAEEFERVAAINADIRQRLAENPTNTRLREILEYRKQALDNAQRYGWTLPKKVPF